MEPRYIAANEEWETLADELKVNQYCFHDDRVYRKDKDGIIKPAVWRTKFTDGFKPRTLEQQAAFHLLDDDNIPIKVLKGIAGSGKTKLTMQFALAKVLDGKKFDRYLIFRNPVAVGEEIGYLKGSLNDKLGPWQNAIIDNLGGGVEGRKTFDYLCSLGKVEFDIPAFAQGRDLKRTFIHVTEAQMLTLEQVKMLGTRVSEGSVIVFEGDDEQVLNKRYLSDNGLKQVVAKLAGHPEFGYMRLTQSVRSNVAELMGKLL